MSLNVVIAGAGIAGLSTAIGLARYGHKVTVYEKRQNGDREQSGSGIQLAANATRIMKQWNMEEEMLKVSLENGSLQVRQWDTGEIWGHDYSLVREGAWFTLRKDIRDMFRLFAVRNGATLCDGIGVVKVDSSGPTAYLDDGTSIYADLIVGGDGSFSKVRQSLFPDFRPDVLNHVVHQVTVPFDVITADPETKTISDGTSPVLWISPERHIFSGPIPKRNVYDLQFCQGNYSIDKDPQPEIFSGTVDVAVARDLYADHPSDVRKLLTKVDNCWKWRLVEVSDVPAWYSDNGKVILIGDSVHGMRPYAAQGSAMGIEDGAILSELLAGARKGDDLTQIAKQFEQVRRPRTERIAEYARENGKFVMTTDPAVRNRMADTIRKGVKPDYDTCKSDPNAEFPTDSFRKWVYYYGVFEELDKFKSATTQAKT